MSQELIEERIEEVIETFIKDTTKQQESKLDNKVIENLNIKNLSTYLNILHGKNGRFSYYGIGYHLFGDKYLGFYKSLNGEMYYISSSFNGIPLNFSKIILRKY